MGDRPSRRRVLAGIGAGVMAGIAGCSDGDTAAQGEGTGADTTGTGDGGDATDDGDEANGDGGGSTDDGTETTDDGDQTTDDGTETTDDGDQTTGDGEASGREIPGEVSNDLSGFEVVEHGATVGEDGFSGTVTVRNVGDETASLLDHEIGFDVFDADGSGLGRFEGWRGDTRELAPGEEGVMEFFDGPAVDVDFSQVASYEVVLTCSLPDPGVYCPEDRASG